MNICAVQCHAPLTSIINALQQNPFLPSFIFDLITEICCILTRQRMKLMLLLHLPI